LAVFGAVGLNGELRAVRQMERRVAEVGRLGFTSCLMPRMSSRPPLDHVGVRLIEAGSVAEALRLGLTERAKRE